MRALFVGLLLVACAAPAAPSLGDVGQHNGDVTVEGEQTISGQITGTLTVAETGNLILNGQVIEDLVVEAGGRAEINGMVIGNIVNRGGDVTVYGQVEGQILDEGTTATVIESGAIIGGEVVP
jgi:cytoskeletal protein CcmA (bactofilin family)